MRYVENSVGAHAYSLYAQGLTFREISEALQIRRNQVAYQLLKYARESSSPYPLPRKKHNGEYLYNLYKNGMPAKAIGKLVGIHKDKVYLRVKAFAKAQGFPNPFVDIRPQKALEMRQTTNMSYSEIAKRTGFCDKSACYRAVQRELAKQK